MRLLRPLAKVVTTPPGELTGGQIFIIDNACAAQPFISRKVFVYGAGVNGSQEYRFDPGDPTTNRWANIALCLDGRWLSSRCDENVISIRMNHDIINQTLKRSDADSDRPEGVRVWTSCG
jgi:hypothetical protein